VGRRIQLKLEAPWLVQREEGRGSASGIGNTSAGVKWRFLGDEPQRITWAVYPQYEFNTSQSSVRKGLVEDGHSLFLPTELTLDFDPIEISVEVGRNFVSGGADTWSYGLAAEASVGPRLALVGEVHGEKPDGSATQLILNGGARAKITAQASLMAAVGRAVHGEPEDKPSLLFYVGLQLNLPDLFDSSAQAGAPPARRPVAPAAGRN
jgi:hypothetical protein